MFLVILYLLRMLQFTGDLRGPCSREGSTIIFRASSEQRATSGRKNAGVLLIARNLYVHQILRQFYPVDSAWKLSAWGYWSTSENPRTSEIHVLRSWHTTIRGIVNFMVLPSPPLTADLGDRGLWSKFRKCFKTFHNSFWRFLAITAKHFYLAVRQSFYLDK